MRPFMFPGLGAHLAGEGSRSKSFIHEVHMISLAGRLKRHLQASHIWGFGQNSQHLHSVVQPHTVPFVIHLQGECSQFVQNILPYCLNALKAIAASAKVSEVTQSSEQWMMHSADYYCWNEALVQEFWSLGRSGSERYGQKADHSCIHCFKDVYAGWKQWKTILTYTIQSPGRDPGAHAKESPAVPLLPAALLPDTLAVLLAWS